MSSYRFFDVVDLGLIEYREAYDVQKALVIKAKRGILGPCLAFAEHLPIFTIGRRGSWENIIADQDLLNRENISILEVDRGGDVTYHGPGQLIIYPIIKLGSPGLPKDLRLYLSKLEELVINFLNGYGIQAQCKEDCRGTWVGDEKIASIGIGVSNWVTFHGLAININNDLRPFEYINPCGISGLKMTSLSKLLGFPVLIKEAKQRILESFSTIFQMRPRLMERELQHKLSVH
jgi:lipoate-protein ligase B